jgi:hypothetical protein
MENYIRYKRFNKDFTIDDDMQEFLDELSSDGWVIIYYNEKPKDVTTLNITVVAGKPNKQIL